MRLKSDDPPGSFPPPGGKIINGRIVFEHFDPDGDMGVLYRVELEREYRDRTFLVVRYYTDPAEVEKLWFGEFLKLVKVTKYAAQS